MPMYLYRCPTCGYEIEIIRTVDERDNPVHCNGFEDCAPGLMERVQAAPGFTVKGFSAINNYSRTDTGWVSQGNGIRTRVSDAAKEKE